MTTLFTFVNRSGIMPQAWTQAIVVPIHKRGDKKCPASYRPISLLSITGKLYANHLLQKSQDWLLDQDILSPEQVGFKAGKSRLDHYMILSHLISKYASQSSAFLYAEPS